MKHIKLDTKGFSHLLIALMIVVISGIAGTGYIVYSKAAPAPPPDNLVNEPRILTSQGSQDGVQAAHRGGKNRWVKIKNDGRGTLYLNFKNCRNGPGPNKVIKLRKGKSTKWYFCGKNGTSKIYYRGVKWGWKGPLSTHWHGHKRTCLPNFSCR